MTPPRKSPFVAPPSLEHGKVPPNAVELEDAVLGACLLESEALSEVSSILRPEMFYKIEHQQVFRAMTSLLGKGDPVDILTVTHELKSMGALELVGGAYYVSKLTDRMGSAANVEYHARIIAQKFIQRELIRVASDIYAEAYSDTIDPLELLDRANDEVASIGSDVVGDTVESNQDLLRQVIEDSERTASGGNVIGTPIGLRELDLKTGGLQEGHLDILAGRSGMGKSTFAIFEAYRVAFAEKKPVLFFSLEMPAKEIMQKILSIHTGIDSWKLKTGKLDPEQWDRINAMSGEIIKAPITIIDNVSEWSKIRTKCVNVNKKQQIGLVTIDYLQIIQAPSKKGNFEQEVAEISRGLKQLAKHLKCPIRALAQLSRAVETRGGNKRPMLSDLRSSGQIEQDADSVTFLYRPEYYGIEFSEEGNLPTSGLCEVIIAKNRGGLTGVVPTRVNLATSTFEDWEGGSFKAPSPPPMEEVQKWSPLPRSSEFDDPYEGPF
jgi:replicative DNA helicase